MTSISTQAVSVNVPDEEAATGVELGFLEPVESSDECLFEMTDWSEWDGGVAGGKPIWLCGSPDLSSSDPAHSLNCRRCGNGLVFLLQVYAPVDSVMQAFHRCLYVFICVEDGCQAMGSAVALRYQLPKINDYYASTAAGSALAANQQQLHDQPWDRWTFPRQEIVVESEPPAALIAEKDALTAGLASEAFENTDDQTKRPCSICKQRSTIQCEQCKCVGYCSTAHQLKHQPMHSALCKQLTAAIKQTEKENAVVLKQNEKGTAQVAAEMTEQGGTVAVEFDAEELLDDDVTQEDLDRFVHRGDDRVKKMLAKDPMFLGFQARVAAEPSQCLRYARWMNDKVLWFSSKNRLGETKQLHSSSSSGGGGGAVGVVVTATSTATENENANKSEESEVTAIPKCENCGSDRAFEFQVMPQLINAIKGREDVVDFGTIAVYTCTNSCDRVCAQGDGEDSDKNARHGPLLECAWVNSSV